MRLQYNQGSRAVDSARAGLVPGQEVPGLRDQGQRCGTPGRAKPDMSNALAEGISRDQGVCLEL